MVILRYEWILAYENQAHVISHFFIISIQMLIEKRIYLYCCKARGHIQICGVGWAEEGKGGKIGTTGTE